MPRRSPISSPLTISSTRLSGSSSSWRRVAFTSWALASQGSLVRSLSRLFLFEKANHDRGCGHAAAHSIGAA